MSASYTEQVQRRRNGNREALHERGMYYSEVAFHPQMQKQSGQARTCLLP
jgi:hypothetical protein